MIFHYIASQPNGKIVEGEADAVGPAEVLEQLAMKGLRPVSIKAVKGAATAGGRRIFSSSITVTDKVFLATYLALILKVGTDLFRAIDILIADFDKPAVKALLLEVRANLEKGQPFYVTFAKYPRFFSSVFVNLIRAGEASGNLDQIFHDLSMSLAKEQELRNRIRSAMVYPILLFIVAAIILIVLVGVAIPRISEVFASSGFEPPFFSRIVFAVGGVIGRFIWLFLALMAGGVAFIAYASRVSVSGRKIIAHFAARIPVISGVLKRIALQRFAATLSSLMRAGLPILEAIEITADAVGSVDLEASLRRISREGIAKGLTIGDAFRREASFPKVVTNLIAISEKAGHVEDILKTLADFYESEIDTSVKTLVSVLEPLMLLMIGVVVGTIALAVIVPIYQLVGQF
ncbi:MAG: type II secretion system F family protein [bacterium]|nr:type II secretion system F family protein [bacterium]